MRTPAKLKLGYYPLALAEAKRIRNFLQLPNEPASVLDPCAGTGAALHAVSEGAPVRRYGIELDAYRADEARKMLNEVIQGSAFDAHAPVDSFSLVYLNPPYDFEIGEGKNQRMERLFLEHVARWVRPGGALVMVIPYLSSKAGADWSRLAAIPKHLFRPNRLFHLHPSAGEPAKLADRTEGAGARRFLHLFGHGAGELSSPDGEEATGLFGDGGQASHGRFAGHGRRRRFAHRDGARTGDPPGSGRAGGRSLESFDKS